MVPMTMKVPVPFDYVFPHGCLCLGVESVTDFDKRGKGDDQARDKETGRAVVAGEGAGSGSGGGPSSARRRKSG